MQSPSVSVIVASHNYGHFIRDAVDSVLGQSCQDFELIVVDDGSSDGTADLLRPYLDRITFVQREHLGHTAARQEGTALSRGRYICYLDADDIYMPEKLGLQLAFLDGHPELDFVFSDFCEFQGDRVLRESFMATLSHFHRVPFRQEGTHRIFTGPLFDAYLRENFILPGTMMVRRDYVSRVGVFRETVRARVLYGKLLFTIDDAHVAYADRVLVKRRRHKDNVSRRAEVWNPASIEIHRELLAKHSSRLNWRQRLRVRVRIARSHWHLGRMAAEDSNFREARGHFRRSLSAWPLQRPSYAGWLATVIPRRRLLRSLGKLRWP